MVGCSQKREGSVIVAVDVDLAYRLLCEQCPQWAEDSLLPLVSTGTDNALFRLGADRLLRLPVAEWAFGQPFKEHVCIPLLGDLPLQISVPLFLGQPTELYPATWSVVRWMEGNAASVDNISDWSGASDQLAEFLKALWQRDTVGSPQAARQNLQRGGDLRQRDETVRKSFELLRDEINVTVLAACWQDALTSSSGARSRKWIHGDLHGGNLIAASGRLVGVIDWGLMGIGDPAVDLMVAWTWLPGSVRRGFMRHFDCEAPVWARAKGWALSVAVIALAYYRGNHEVMERMSRNTIQAIIDGS